MAENIVEITPRFVKFLRANDQVDIRQFIKNRSSPALGHTAQKTDDLMLAMFFASFQRLHFADRLLLGHVAHRAGVEQDDIGVFFAFHEIVAAARQVAGDLFGVAHVHLATVGFDEDGRHGTRRLPCFP